MTSKFSLGYIVKRLKNLLVTKKGRHFRPFVIRKGALALYVAFLAIFNFFAVPLLGFGNRAYGSTISTERLVQLANQARSSAGIPPLTVDNRLVQAAEAKGHHMFEHQYWAHYAPDGTSPWFFILQAGYNYIYAGENLAKDFITADAVHEAWMNSPSHRENILNPHYKNIGIAAIEGTLFDTQTTIVVQMFGALEEVSPPQYPQKPSPKPVQETKDTIPPKAPEITSPKNGQILNNSEVTISGKGENDSVVSVYDNEIKRVEVTANDGLFSAIVKDLKDGQHYFSADARDKAGNTSPLSNIVNVTIDTIPPSLIHNKTKMAKQDNGVLLYIQTNEPVRQVLALFEGSTIELKEVLGKNQTAFSEIISTPGGYSQYEGKRITLTFVDKAGNSSTATLTLPTLAKLSAPSENLPPIKIKGISSHLLADTVSYIRALTPQQKVNIAVGLFLIVLFLIDAIVLWRMGMFREGTKTVFHLPILIIAIIVTVFGFNGLII